MYYSGIIENDVANGPGIRTSLFVSGCRNNCPGCFNKVAQDFKNGELFTEAVEDYIINTITPNYAGITLLGGDPLEPENALALLPLINKFRDKFKYSKSIWIYSGYIYEDIINYNDCRTELMKKCDVLVDGRFVKELKDFNLMYRGSSNQRLIDIKKSTNDNIVLLDL